MDRLARGMCFSLSAPIRGHELSEVRAAKPVGAEEVWDAVKEALADQIPGLGDEEARTEI